MPYMRRIAWVEKIKTLKPKESTIADSLLKIGKAVGKKLLTKMDKIWCAIVPQPERHQSDSGNKKRC